LFKLEIKQKIWELTGYYPPWLRGPRGTLLINGVLALWLGSLLAPVNGFPLSRGLAFMATLGVILLIAGMLFLCQGRGALLLSLGVGLVPLGAGYYLQSGHWASELFLFGLLLSLSAFNALLSGTFVSYQADLQAGIRTLVVRFGLVSGAFIYTLINILIIAGLVLCLLFPATPLPFHGGLWLLIIMAVVCQELVKRQQYKDPQGQTILQVFSLVVNLGIGIFFLLITWGRL
jgi:hypothetical protein